MTYLVTGSAGFIGFHTVKRLLEEGNFVVGVDNFNDYYDQKIKEDRNKVLEKFQNFKLYRGNIIDLEFVRNIFSENKIDKICHLAAQAGVRYSIKNPYSYSSSNLIGFLNILNEAKNFDVKEFIFASSSSVYGNNTSKSLSENMNTDNPMSLYAATKKSNELIAYAYHHLFGMKCIGLRFFTVYGPYGRPDMAMFIFTKSIIENNPITVFNNGEMRRDFTYIDDVVDGLIKSLKSSEKWGIFNLGNSNPVNLGYMIELLEKKIGKVAKKEFLPIQPGDVPETHADIKLVKEKLSWNPKVGVEEGINNFVDWYREYFKV